MLNRNNQLKANSKNQIERHFEFTSHLNETSREQSNTLKTILDRLEVVEKSIIIEVI